MSYTSHLLKKKLGLRRHDRDTRSQLAQSFRSMYRNLGMDLPACAKFLHVTQRTLHKRWSGQFWLSQRTRSCLVDSAPCHCKRISACG